jgi:serine/threonine protein phosphatase PrpC
MKTDYAELSMIGDREENQDRVGIVSSTDAILLMVFDGMGGHSDGALAADTALQVVSEAFESASKPLLDPQGFLYSTLALAHDAVVTVGREVAVDFRPRATCALALVQDGGMFRAHIGDSRVYQMRAGQVVDRSRDHSHVEVLIQQGAITEEQAQEHPMRNFVESCLGGDWPVPEMCVTGKSRLQQGDVVLVCTDGFWSGLVETGVAKVVATAERRMEDLVGDLCARAVSVNSPYSDNTTVAGLRWLGNGAA